MLDVKLRADLGHVISVLFTPAPLQQRAVRRLLPANPAEDAQRLADFVRWVGAERVGKLGNHLCCRLENMHTPLWLMLVSARANSS
jgi:hypothetical protein